MSEPMLFSEMPPEDQPSDRLLFALYPDPETASRIATQARLLRLEQGLSGKPLLTDRFHVTLAHIGDYHGLPSAIVRDAALAAGKVLASSFEVVFDQAASFSGKRGNHPFVLLSSGVDPLIQFQRTLCVEMIKAGVRYKGRGEFTPHVTLLYDAALVQRQIIDPIRWTAREFLLVHSLLGQNKHVPLCRWSLD